MQPIHDFEAKPIAETEGAKGPFFSSDGNALYYRDISGNKMMAVSFINEPELHVSKPQLLFEGKYYGGMPWGRNYDIAPDGKRVMMITVEERKVKPTQINMILNWSEEIKRIVPPDN